MIGFYINGGFLDLFPGAKVNFEVNSEIYTTGEPTIVEGSYSFPFTVPLSANNRKLLNFPHLIDNFAPMMADADATFYAGSGQSVGFPLYQGKLFVMDAVEDPLAGDTAEISFIIKGLAVKKELKFEDVDMGTYDLGATDLADHMTDTTIHPLDYDHVFFPVWNPTIPKYPPVIPLSYQIPGGPLYEQFINGKDKDGLWYFKKSTTSSWARIQKNGVLVPFMRLKSIVAKVVAALGYNLEDKWLVEEELQLICMFNNYSINNLDTGWNNIIRYNNHVPAKMKLVDFLKDVCRMFFVGIFLNIDNNTLSLIPYKDLLDQSHKHDWTAKAELRAGNNQDNRVPRGFYYALDTSDEYTNNNYVSENALLAGGVTITDYTAAEAIPSGLADGFYNAIRENAIYQKTGDYIGIWSHKFKGISTNGGRGQDVTFNASPLFERFYSATTSIFPFTFDEGQQIVPICAIPMNLRLNITIDNDESPIKEFTHELSSIRLTFYRGNRPLVDGYAGTWPYANSNAYDPTDEMETFDYSMHMDGEKGIYNKWAKEWIYFMLNKKVRKQRFLLSISDVLNWKQYDKVRVGSMMYFVKSMRLSFSDKGMDPVECEIVSIPLT